METTTRTVDNDNDKANKYFRDPAASTKEKYSAAQLQFLDDGDSKKTVLASDGNELIERLRQQSVDNKEKNDKIVRAKTLQNDMVSLTHIHVKNNHINISKFFFITYSLCIC